MNGWIKLHRKIRESPIFNDPKLFRLWIICLTEASHKERDQIIGKQIVNLKPGEFVTGRFDILDLYNKGLPKGEKVSGEKTVFRWLELLEKGSFLTIKKTTKYSVVSVTNWCLYQENDQQMTTKRPTNDQQMTTNKNVKNVKNVNKDIVHQDELFELWWNLYDNKKGKVKCLTKYKSLLKKHSHDDIMTGTEKYIRHRKDLVARNEFLPQQKNPLTFLNGEHFNDEYGSSTTPFVNKQPSPYKPFNADDFLRSE